MLQNYLNANLINVTDDEVHKKLSKASSELVKRLQKSKSKVAEFTLTAIDGEVGPENLSILEVKELIIKNWTTFTANAKDTPLVFIRAVILDALSTLVGKENFSEVIWFTSRNIVRYSKLFGEEKDIIFDFLKEIGDSINQSGIIAWTIEKPVKRTDQKFELKGLTKYLINDDSLTKYMEDAAGPEGKDGDANFATPNPVWPSNTSTWSHEFAPRAAKGIKKIVDLSLQAIENNMAENNRAIQKVINDKLDEQISGDKDVILAIRSELLWWKEAGYSMSTDNGYDNLDKKIMGLILAYDYSEFIPPIYPKSVDYFLKHTFRDIGAQPSDGITLKDYFDGVAENSNILKPVFHEIYLEESLSNLLNFTIKLINNEVKASDFSRFAGISLETKLNVEDLVLWLFHDFILVKLLKQK